jgi:phosphate transport system permease protein
VTRLALDVLWGVPSIVYGAFGFIIMLALGMRASLLGGIITLAFLELPLFVQELAMGLWLVIKGFNKAALEELLA